MKKRFLSILFKVFLLVFAFILIREEVQSRRLNGPEAPQASSQSEILAVLNDQAIFYLEPPAELNIEVPFYTQAPFGDWGYPWQEACEEASILLVANQELGFHWTRDQFKDQILKLVEYQNKTFGDYKHTSVDQTVQMIEENFDLETAVHENPTFEDIQKIIASGHLIVAPFAGKELKNPNFKNGGPTYHMLVIKGYNKSKHQIVTHDVGTRNGADYVYSWSTIQRALHDWNEEDILKGAPRIIEVFPKETKETTNDDSTAA